MCCITLSKLHLNSVLRCQPFLRTEERLFPGWVVIRFALNGLRLKELTAVTCHGSRSILDMSIHFLLCQGKFDEPCVLPESLRPHLHLFLQMVLARSFF